MNSETRAAWNLSFYYAITTAQLSRWVNPMNIAQRSWVRHQLPFSCHWAQYIFATRKCFVTCLRDVIATALYIDIGIRQYQHFENKKVVSPPTTCQHSFRGLKWPPSKNSRLMKVRAWSEEGVEETHVYTPKGAAYMCSHARDDYGFCGVQTTYEYTYL